MKKLFQRNCPDCNDVIYYTDIGNYTKSLKHNYQCRKCYNNRIYTCPNPNNNPKCKNKRNKRAKVCVSCKHYGRKLSEDTKLKISNGTKGENSPNFGKIYTEKEKKHLSNKLKEFRKINPVSDKTKEKMSISAKKHWQPIIEQNKLKMPEKKRYYNDVRRITRQQPIHLLENYNKIGLAGISGAYHVDHMVSKKVGFDNNIDPNIIGNIVNLQIIPWLENVSKIEKCSISIEQLLEKYNKTKC